MFCRSGEESEAIHSKGHCHEIVNAVDVARESEQHGVVFWQLCCL